MAGCDTIDVSGLHEVTLHILVQQALTRLSMRYLGKPQIGEL